MRVKWAPFCNLVGPFSRKGIQETGDLKGIWIGTFWATEKAWARITAEYRMFSGEIVSQTKKRKAIETVRGYKSSM